MNKDFYDARIEVLLKKKKELETTFNKISMLRLFSAVAAVLTVCISRSIPFLIVSGLFVFGFIYLVRKHIENEAESELTKSRLEVLYRLRDRFTSEWKKDSEDGSCFAEENFPQGRDLDIIGKASLYQYMCFCETTEGKQKLYKLLKDGCSDIDKIKENQQAVSELSEKNDFTLEFLSLCKNAISGKKTWFSDDISAPSKTNIFMEIISFLLPICNIILILLILSGNNIFQTIFFIVSSVCFALSCLTNALNGKVPANLEKLRKGVVSYRHIASILENEKFESDKMKKISGVFRDTNASVVISKLIKIADRAEMRGNMFSFFILNSLFMWDVHCMSAYEKWYSINGINIKKWTDAISDTEVISSLLISSIADYQTVYPEITESNKPFVTIENLRHPLISTDKVVGNPVSFKNQTIVITGSNMSGKTTFMRSIGVNLILAYVGAPVRADSFRASFMKILTSIKTEDSVSDGISTFYAELLRIKSMVDYVNTDKPVLLLIDEIFKGTNSADRIICAKETIKRLSRTNSIVIVTTHDFELCTADLGASETVNYHFSEYYQDGKLMFDYKIKDGRCVTTNAQQLLRMAGIVE